MDLWWEQKFLAATKTFETLISYGKSIRIVPGPHNPISWKNPSRLEQPGPPLSQMVTSSTGAPIVG